jgi:hypothetical protein
MPFATKLNCEEKIPFYANTAGFLPLLPYQPAKMYLSNSKLTAYSNPGFQVTASIE